MLPKKKAKRKEYKPPGTLTTFSISILKSIFAHNKAMETLQIRNICYQFVTQYFLNALLRSNYQTDNTYMGLIGFDSG
jgi:hypothetical protein